MNTWIVCYISNNEMVRVKHLLKYGIRKRRSGLRKVNPYCNSLDTQSSQGSSSQFVVIISQQTEEDFISYLDGFRNLFWEVIYNKVEKENPPSENEDHLMKKQRVKNIRKETDVVTDRMVNDLSSWVKRLELDVGDIVG